MDKGCSFKEYGDLLYEESVCFENLGNTCFMSSILQCLRHTRFLFQVCVANKDKISKCFFFSAYVDLMKNVAQSKGHLSLRPFVRALKSITNKYNNHNQQDAQEFLILLLDKMHQELRALQFEPTFLSHLTARPDLQCRRILEVWRNKPTKNVCSAMGVFLGLMKSTQTCLICGSTSEVIERFHDLSLPIPTSSRGDDQEKSKKNNLENKKRCKKPTGHEQNAEKINYDQKDECFDMKECVVSDSDVKAENGRKDDDEITLMNCFDAFLKKEILEGDDQPFCRECQQKRPCSKQFSISKLPDYLIIHLKRFKEGGKLKDLVEYPLNNFDLSKYAPSPNGNTKQAASYHLYSVCVHTGGLSSGHYTAYAKSLCTGDWHVYNDATVGRLKEEEVVSRNAYILFYEKDDFKMLAPQ